MLTISTTRTIDRPPADILDFVMDARAYQRVDSKIRPVLSMRREDNTTEFTFMGRLAGLPTPPTTSRMVLTPGERVDISLPAGGVNRLVRKVSDFSASFVCTPGPDGTVVVRTLNFDLRSVLHRLEPFLRPRLTREVEDEMDQLKRHLEQQDPAAS